VAFAQNQSDPPKPQKKAGKSAAVTSADRAKTIQIGIKALFKKRPSYWKNLGKVDMTVKGRKGFQAALTEWDEASDSGQYIIHATKYLSDLPPSDDFGHVLWRLLSHVEWTERSAGEELFPKLAELAKQLPHDSDPFYECRFLEASHHHAHGRGDKSLKILNEIRKSDRLPAEFGPTLDYRMGQAHEINGDWDAALASYKAGSVHDGDGGKPRPDGENFGLAGTIRSIFIHLGHDRRATAKKMLSAVDGIPLKELGRIPGGFQVGQMRQLQERGELEKVWAHQDRWWKDFEKAFALINDEKPEFPGGIAIPAIMDETIFAGRLARVAEVDDIEIFTHGLWLAAEAARWDVNSVNNLAKLVLFQATEIVPQRSNPLRQFVVKICEDFRLGDTRDQHGTSLYHAIALLQLDRSADALVVAEQGVQGGKPSPEDPAGQALLRLWATSVRRADGDVLKPGRALEGLLESEIKVHDRIATVDALTRLYQHIGEPEAEESLLQRELTKSEYEENPEALQSLVDRFRARAEIGRESRDLTRAVSGWMTNEAPAWLRIARPNSIEDLEPGELAKLLEDPRGKYSFLEVARLKMLAARESSLDFSTRLDAFQESIEIVTGIRSDFGLLHETYSSLANNEGFPEPQRRYYAWLALANAAYSDHKPTMWELLNSPLLEDPGERLEDAMLAARHLRNCNRLDAESVAETIAKIAEGRVGSFDLLAINVLTSRLLELGEVEEARKIASQIAGWDLDDNAAQGRMQLGMQMLTSIGEHERRAKINPELGEVALELFPEAGQKRPEFFHRLDVSDTPPDWISDAEVVEWLIYQVRSGIHHNWNFEIWLELCHQIPHPTPADQLDRKFHIVRTLLETLEKDEDRGDVINELGSLFDIDDQEERRRVIELIEPFGADPKQSPACAFAVALYHVAADMRDGKEVDAVTAFRGLKDDSKRFFEIRYALDQAIKKGDRNAIKEVLDSMDDDELNSSEYSRQIYLANEVMGVESTPELLDQIRSDRDAMILYAAAAGSPSAAYRALDATRALGDVDALPDGWFEAFLENCKRTRQRAMTASMKAELEQDWEGLIKASDDGIKHFSTYYDFYRFRGLGMAKLGRTEEAIEALEIYCRYSANELEYPEMLELLNELKNLENE